MLGKLFLSASICFVGLSAFGAQLNYGKYFGTIQMENQSDVIAVSMDAFVTQIRDPETYPALEIIIRANLGGFNSSEYIGSDFYNPSFNFEKGVLKLDDPKENLSATLQVTNTESQTILEGPIVHRMKNAKGHLRLVMNLDDAEVEMPSGPIVPILAGEYFGKCAKEAAALQIETARVQADETAGNALVGYSITGRIGFRNGTLCDLGKNQFCNLYPFSTGTYSPFSTQLTMQGPLATLSCVKFQDSLQCDLSGFDGKRVCKFDKKTKPPTPPIQAPASFLIDVSPAGMAVLPDPRPPANEALVGALNGEFFGFLHHENRDIYQLMEMNLVASTSTVNPHIENQVLVEPTMNLRLGSSWDSSSAVSFLYPQRVFWMNSGFSFQGEEQDLFVVIGNWRVGYLSGVLYSRSFGRVGTFEMIKDSRPTLPPGMPLTQDPEGDFLGPSDSLPSLRNSRKLSVEVRGQTTGPGLPLVARYGGPGIQKMFDLASFDFNSGQLSFLIKNEKGDRLITGQSVSTGALKLLWPVGPSLAAPMANYRPLTYQRKY